MKTIAFYLPQFHPIPENDAWWGEGFTEWVNVRKAKPQFPGHAQPEEPLEYYDLLDPAVPVAQAKLARDYGIDGFCYYHYWFGGKLLLEQPMERMLRDPAVDIPFCVCWANESWTRAWDGQQSQVLMEQTDCRSREDWKAHFDYLLPFFRDPRYITWEGKPMVLIYKPQLMAACREMLAYWQSLAREAGFPGLYLGYQHHSAFDADCPGMGFDFGVEFEPFYTVRRLQQQIAREGKLAYGLGHPAWLWEKLKGKLLGRPLIYDYDRVWQQILSRSPEKPHVMPGAFPAWDNTPRRGAKGAVFRGASPEKFRGYLTRQLARAGEVYAAPFLFLNAWNEWAEGAHLEPDRAKGYGYLEALRAARQAQEE